MHRPDTRGYVLHSLEAGGHGQAVQETVRTFRITRPGVTLKKVMAERVGFEPTLPFRVNTLSKRAPSATRPSLPCGFLGGKSCSSILQEILSQLCEGRTSGRFCE